MNESQTNRPDESPGGARSSELPSGERPQGNRPLLWIMAGLIAWGVVLAGGVFFVWNDELRWWRAVIVLGMVGLFVGCWLLVLRRSEQP